MKSFIRGIAKDAIEFAKSGILPYRPRRLVRPDRLIDGAGSSWRGLELIMADIVERACVGKSRCLEFGVEAGYSTAVLANFFESVIGVDTFQGDEHAGFKGDMLPVAQANLAAFKNITLLRADYRDFIRNNDEMFDLIHIDIVHTFADTFRCGAWAAEHSHCAIFHDTESFPEVKRAVVEISKQSGKKFRNYRPCSGLGILF